MNVVVTSSGHTIRLGQKLGGGGEGNVYEAHGRSDWALKIYLPGLAAERHPKIQAMVTGRWSQAARSVAFPVEALFDARGQFVGFAMHRVAGFKPIHQLYGPSSRKVEFPKADFRFLIHTAMNVARAIAEVHSTGCVIGDINHSGVLVSERATVTLIDSDSFQVTSNGRLYRCKVGVPEFTPPELQGLNLSSVTRTVTHDGFGLAVLIFQLLFMGRHPFAGTPIKGRDHQLTDWIKGFRFAYSPRQDVTLMKPPPGVPALVDLPPTMALAFQRAFERESVSRGRPSAAEWASLLHTTAREITACRANPAHFYYRAAASCPWCRMEQQVPGLLLFVPAGAGVVLTSLDIQGLTAALKAIADPGAAPPALSVVAPPTNLQHSAVAIKAHNQRQRRYVALAAGFGVGALIVAVYSALTLVGLAVIAGSWLVFKRLSDGTAQLQAAKKQAEDQWEAVQRRWDADAGNQKFLEGRDKATKAIQELAALPQREQRLLNELNQKKREIQLSHFLDGHRIEKASIAKIGRGRRLLLASYGIETAADVDQQRLLSIPTIGPAVAKELLSWRQSLEWRFVFNPATAIDPSEIARVKALVASEKAAKVGEARRLIHSVDQIAAEIKARRRSMQSALQASYRALKQAEYDASIPSAAAVSGLITNQPAIAAILVGFIVVGLALGIFLPIPPAPTPKTHTETVTKEPKPIPDGAPSSADRGQVGNAKPAAPPSAQTETAQTPKDTETSARPPAMPPIPNPTDVSTDFEITGSVPSDDLPEASSTLPMAPMPPPLNSAVPGPSRQLDTVEGALAVQTRLIELGLLKGPADGKWGPRSRDALRAFRTSVGLGTDDQWNLETEASLFHHQTSQDAVGRRERWRPLQRWRPLEKLRPFAKRPLER